MRIAFLISYGLLPLWAALAFIVFGLSTMSAEHAGMTLWALVPAIPACGVTLLIAGITVAVHSRVNGEPARKLRMATAFVAASSMALAIAGIALWANKRGNDQDILAEKIRVEEFTRSNVVVQAAAGGPFTTSVNSYSIDRSGPLPTVYDVSVIGPRTIYAIVEVDRKSKPPEFKLRCTTPLYMGQREVFKDPCAH